MKTKEEIEQLAEHWFENSNTERWGVDDVLGHMGADRGYEFWTQVKEEIDNI